MKKYNGGDVMLVEKWSVIDDSILNIGGIGYAVTRISNKMIKINISKIPWFIYHLLPL